MFRPPLRFLPGVHLLLVLAVLGRVPAVEVGAEVVSTTDGNTLVVTVAGTKETVRLLYIDTPESKTNDHGDASREGKLAAEFMDLQAKPGSAVTLWGPKATLERDRYQRILAVVVTTRGDTLQERVISAGWSPLWEKYGKADAKWRAALQAAEDKARKDKAGAWTTDPTYMANKANETTAPRGKAAERGDADAPERETPPR